MTDTNLILMLWFFALKGFVWYIWFGILPIYDFYQLKLVPDTWYLGHSQLCIYSRNNISPTLSVFIIVKVRLISPTWRRMDNQAQNNQIISHRFVLSFKQENTCNGNYIKCTIYYYILRKYVKRTFPKSSSLKFDML